MLAQSTKSLRACKRRLGYEASLTGPSYRSYTVLKSCSSDRVGCAISLVRFSLPVLSIDSRTRQICHSFRKLAPGGPLAASYSTDTSPSKHTAIKDDFHPSLFYHLFDDDELLNPVYSLSFIEERPLYARSKTVLGWLPALSSGESKNGGNGLNDFVPNQEFLPVLHKTVKEGLLEDEMWINAAIQIQSGWMHIFDQRNTPPLGRIPDPDDILASVRVEEGHMLIDTYEPMPSYRLCTADGVCRLTETLSDQLKASLKQITIDERQSR